MFSKKYNTKFKLLTILFIFSLISIALIALIVRYHQNQIDSAYPSYVKEFLDNPTEFSENKCDEECLAKRIDTVTSKIEAVTTGTNLKIELLNGEVKENKQNIEKNKDDLGKITQIFKKVSQKK